MKTIVLKSTNKQFFVEIKVDLMGSNDAFTIMSIEGKSDSEVVAGFDFKQLPSTVKGMKTFAEDNNLLMDIIDIDPAVSVINTVSSVTALNITTTGSMTRGTGKAEITSIACVADTAGSLNNKYFTCSSPSTNYYVWLNVNSAGVDPEVANKTGVEVAVATGATATQVATAAAAALHALADFTATSNTSTVTLTNVYLGNTTNAANVDAGFTPTVSTAGIAASNYHQPIVTEGGNGPLTFSVSSGSLPAGLTLDTKSGYITGIPTTAETATFTIAVADAFGATDSQASISINTQAA